MDVTHRDHGDAGHGYNQFAVFLDALDIPLGTLVDAVGHAHPVADVVLRRVGTEILDVPAGIGGDHEDEGAHLDIANGTGTVGPGLGVVHEVRIVFMLELHEPLRSTPHEHQRRDQLLLDIGQAPCVVLLHGVERDIGLDTFAVKQRLEVNDSVVEYLQGVPVESLGGRFDEMLGHKAEDISPTPRPSGD